MSEFMSGFVVGAVFSVALIVFMSMAVMWLLTGMDWENNGDTEG